MTLNLDSHLIFLINICVVFYERNLNEEILFLLAFNKLQKRTRFCFSQSLWQTKPANTKFYICQSNKQASGAEFSRPQRVLSNTFNLIKHYNQRWPYKKGGRCNKNRQATF